MKYIDTDLVSQVVWLPMTGGFNIITIRSEINIDNIPIKKLNYLWETHNFSRIKSDINDKINIDMAEYNIVRYKLPLLWR